MKKTLFILFALLMGVSGAWAEFVQSLGQISANKCYTVTTPGRGSWTMNADGTSLVSSLSSSASSSADDAKWAFVKVSDKTYLYNVGAQKFILKNGSAGEVNTNYGTPIELYQYQSTEMAGWGESAYYDTWQSEGYVFNAKCGLDGEYTAFINFGSSYNTTIDGWGPGNTAYSDKCGADAGNCLKIEEADDFDPTAIVDAINSTWNITSSDLSTNFWSALGEDTPADVTALGNYTAYARTQDVTLTSTSYLNVMFLYSSGSQRLDILGIDLLDGGGNVVASDYHKGYTGTYRSLNSYQLTNIPAGTYKLRYIIAGGISSSAGNIYFKHVKLADSYANISQWYTVRMHANQTHYMYYDSEASTGISFASNANNITDNYLWGFVQTNDGVQVYNKAAGSTLAIDNATPSTMSTDGTSMSFSFTTSAEGSYGLASDAFFALYQTAGSYLNYQNATLQRWTSTDAGSTFMVNETDFGTLNYAFTDMNGAIYSGTYEGYSGVTEPTITGCYGYTLSNKVWEGNTFTATITFPFNVSSNGITNYVNISNYTGNAFFWYVKDGSTQVCVTKNSAPTNINYQPYDWAIIPASSNGTFTFTIQNSDGRYITSTEATTTTNAHNAGIVYVSDAATNLTYTSSGWLLSTNRYLSVNSSGTATEQNLGAYPNSHNGTAVTFKAATDFATLNANLLAACVAFQPYNTLIGTGLNQYSGETATEMQAAYLSATTATTLTAEELTSYVSTLENPASKLTLNMPATNKFYRFNIGDNYMCNVASSDNVRTTTTTNNDASTIFYLNDANYLIAYADGYGFNYGYCKATAPGIFNSFDFSESSALGKYQIHSNPGTESNAYSNRYITINGDKLAEGNGAWAIEEVTSLPVTISSVGFATLYSPVALSIPEGVTAYVGTTNNNVINLTAISDGVIPANTGVILEGEAGTYNFAITTGGTATSDITGTVAAQLAANVSGIKFVLANGNNGVGFYKYNGTNLGGFRAYLVDGANSSSGFTFNFVNDDDPTAVESAVKETVANGQYYDLQGRKVAAPQKGQIYIVNGKKVLY